MPLKEIVAISCSWCKNVYHNKETCFTKERLTESCTLGIHADIIIPHSWIVKLPRKGSFKSSIRRTTKSKRNSSKKKPKRDDDHAQQQQAIAASSVPPQNVLQNVSQNIPQNVQSSGVSPQPPPAIQQQQSIQSQSSITNENIAQIPSQQSSLQQQQSTDTPGVDTSTSSGSGSGHLSSATAFTYSTTPNQPPVSASGLNDSPPIELSFPDEPPPPPPSNQLVTSSYANASCPVPTCIHSMAAHHKSFAIKPIPNPSSKPLLCFINPRSGGNQGVKLMQKIQWLLNPRQSEWKLFRKNFWQTFSVLLLWMTNDGFLL